jgi:hypothetical protein
MGFQINIASVRNAMVSRVLHLGRRVGYCSVLVFRASPENETCGYPAAEIPVNYKTDQEDRVQSNSETGGNPIPAIDCHSGTEPSAFLTG